MVDEKSKKTKMLSYIILFVFFGLLSFLIYSNIIDSPFILDSVGRIKEDPSPNRPVANATFALNYFFYQYDPRSYNIVNIVIHFLNGFLLFLLIKNILSFHKTRNLGNRFLPEDFNQNIISIFAAMIWLVHPLHINSVTYIVQRMNSLAAFFYLIAFLLYIEGRNVYNFRKHSPVKNKLVPFLYYSGAIVAWGLSLGSKQITVVFPFFLVAFEFFFYRNLDTRWLKKIIIYSVPVIIIFSVIVIFYGGTSIHETFSSLKDFSNNEFTFKERVLTQPSVVVYYLSLIFFPSPSRLNIDYDFPLSHSLIDPVVTLLSISAIIMMAGFVIYTAKRDRIISFCVLWFFGHLVIESTIIPLAIIFEHRTYMPSMLLPLLFSIMVLRVVKYKKLWTTLMIFTVIGLSVWTYQRNSLYIDKIAIWSDCARKSPGKARPLKTLGIALSERGKYSEAIKLFEKAIEAKPYSAEPSAELYSNLGVAFYKQGKLKQSIEQYTKALQIDPNSDRIHSYLSVSLAKQGNMKEAIEHGYQAVQLNPDSYVAHLNLAIHLAAIGNLNQAIRHYEKAINLNPGSAITFYKLGKAYYANNNLNKAIECFYKAMKIDPNLAVNCIDMINAIKCLNN